MTEKIALVKTIGRMAYEMGLNKYYVLSKNVEEKIVNKLFQLICVSNIFSTKICAI